MSLSLYRRFETATFSALLDEAREYLSQYEGVNDPYSGGRNRSFSPGSYTCVRATPEGIDFNFASRGMQTLMVWEIPVVEALLDTAWDRMCGSRGHMRAGKDICDRLERETQMFLNSLRGEGPLDLDEIRDFACESVEPFFAPVR